MTISIVVFFFWKTVTITIVVKPLKRRKKNIPQIRRSRSFNQRLISLSNFFPCLLSVTQSVTVTVTVPVTVTVTVTVSLYFC